MDRAEPAAGAAPTRKGLRHLALAIVILAAGKGTRLNSSRPKVLHEIGGKGLLQHCIDTALKIVPAKDVYVVIGHQAERVRTATAQSGVRFVEQEEQKGTGHAIQQTLTSLRPYEHVLVLSGDVPLLREETVLALRDFHIRERAAMTILSARVEKPFGYGRILHTSGSSREVKAIVEQKQLTPKQEPITEINSGIYAFAIPQLEAHIDSLKADNAQNELFLTDLAAKLHEERQRVLSFEAPSATEVLGANTIAEMMALDRALRLRTAERHMAAGVTIFAPDTVFIDDQVEIGADTVIEPYVQLRGSTSIGTDCTIRSFAVLENASIETGVTIRQGCIITDCEICSGAMIGPYAHLRPRSKVGEGAHVGNFVELKQTVMGKGAKANHLSYLGDTEIGDEANVGAGTIVCNYDGVQKHKTRIGAKAFIGSDAVLVAPVSVGEGAYVAAASCITEDVPEGALAIGRAQQANKANWASRRRARQPIQAGKR